MKIRNWKIKISQRVPSDTSPPPPLLYTDNSTAILTLRSMIARHASAAGGRVVCGASYIVSVCDRTSHALVSLACARETLRLVMDYGRTHTAVGTGASTMASCPASIHTSALPRTIISSYTRSRRRQRTPIFRPFVHPRAYTYTRKRSQSSAEY